MRRFATCCIPKGRPGTRLELSARRRPCSNRAFETRIKSRITLAVDKKTGRASAAARSHLWSQSAPLWSCGAGVKLVRVFRLNGIGLSGQREGRVVPEGCFAEITDLRAEIDQ